jgi:hypothetical protein
MNTLMSVLFLVAFAGMVLSYPAYFYLLLEFGKRLERDHPEVWARVKRYGGPGRLGASYLALRAFKGGRIHDVELSRSTQKSRKQAAVTLLAAVAFFLVFLLIFLAESLSSPGSGLSS